MAQKKFMNGGMNQNTICFPKQLKDLLIIFLYPPLYIIMKEYKSVKFNIMNVLVCFVLTCAFYFPGVVYAMKKMRDEDIYLSNA